MSSSKSELRHDWNKAEIDAIYAQPFNDLLYQAHQVHRQHFDHNVVQTSSILSIKTGACPEDCKYCSQSGHYKTGLQKEKLMSVEEVVKAAKKAKGMGSTRFCMGAAWRYLFDHEMKTICDMVREVKALGLETCCTLGMLNEGQAKQLKQAGLDYYNHNLDTSPEYYKKIITTRTYQDRLQTLEQVRQAGIHVCCGGILSMGESRTDRIGLLQQLVNLPEHPKSVTINMLIKIPGTPLENAPNISPIEFVRAIATARILMPHSFVRLSAGRYEMSDETHALCFFAGANSIHFGEKNLTTPLPNMQQEEMLFQELGVRAMQPEELATA